MTQWIRDMKENFTSMCRLEVFVRIHDFYATHFYKNFSYRDRFFCLCANHSRHDLLNHATFTRRRVASAMNQNCAIVTPLRKRMLGCREGLAAMPFEDRVHLK